MSHGTPLVDYLESDLGFSARLDLARRLIAICERAEQVFTPYQVAVDLETGTVQLELSRALGVREAPLPYIPPMVQAYLPAESIESEDYTLRATTRVYLAGTYVYLALTGAHPLGWVADAILELQVGLRPPTPLERFDPALPRPLCDLVLAMLAKDPEERPESLASVSAALERLGTLEDVETAELDLAELLPRPNDVHRSSPGWGLAAAMLVLAVAVGWFQWQRFASSDPSGSTTRSAATVPAPPDPRAEAVRMAAALADEALGRARPVAEEPQAALSAALLRLQAIEALERSAPGHPDIASLRLAVEGAANEFIAEARRVGGERAETYLEMVLEMSPAHPIALQEMEALQQARAAEAAAVASKSASDRKAASARAGRARQALAHADRLASNGALFNPTKDDDAYRSYAEVLRLYPDLPDIRRGANKGLGDVVGQLRADVQAFVAERKYVEAQRVLAQLNAIAGGHPSVLSPRDRWLTETASFLEAATDPERLAAQEAQRKRDIASWMSLAMQRVEQDKYILPEEDSAAWYLRRVLSLDPENEQARKRLALLIEGPQIEAVDRKIRQGGPDEIRDAQRMIVALKDHFPENTKLADLEARSAGRMEELSRLGRLEMTVRGKNGVFFPEVFVNNEPLGQQIGSPMLTVLELEPARYLIRLEAMFYDPWEQWVDLKAGEVVRLSPRMISWGERKRE